MAVDVPIFSVVIPTYNRRDKLKRAVESVLGQSFSLFEVLVMDDGSTDDTGSIVAAINDFRVTYEWEENFGGPARPRNRGIARAKGEWICFLDADDWWSEDKLQSCFDCIGDNVDLIYHDLRIVRDSQNLFRRNIVTKSRQVNKPVLMDLLLNGNVIANSSVVVRKRLLDEVGGISENVEMIASEDYNTWLRIARVTDAFLYTPQVLGYYSVHDANISNKNMYLNWRCSTSEFGELLSIEQKNAFDSATAYLSGRYKYSNGLYDEALKELKYCLPYASSRNRWRALVTIVLISIKRVLSRGVRESGGSQNNQSVK